MDLEQRVQKIVAQNVETEQEVTLDSKLREDLEVDSLGTIILVDALEEAFSLEINENDFNEIETVKDIVERLQDKTEGGK